jgi:hypothetical protein
VLYSVQLRLEDGDIGSQMTEMRFWLDLHRFEPDVFQYRMEADAVVFRVEFKASSEAAAFAEAFGGSLVNQ